jgi:hypothetical protein
MEASPREKRYLGGRPGKAEPFRGAAGRGPCRVRVSSARSHLGGPAPGWEILAIGGRRLKMCKGQNVPRPALTYYQETNFQLQ